MRTANAVAFARHSHAVLLLHWPISVNGRLRCSCRRGVDCGATAAKHPLGRLAPNGLLSATTHEATIRKWFAEAPAANLGVRTDRLIVLDVDPRHDGDASLRALEREYGELPPTWRTLTGGGGEHIIFACPDGVVVRSSQARDNPVLGAGVDIRAQGGYIVAPPSRHISGRAYAFSVDHHPADVPLVEPPDWLLQKFAAGAHGDAADIPLPKPPADWLKLTRQPVTEYHDRACARFCGYLVRHLDPVVALDILFWWNERICQPPLDDNAVLHIWRRIVHREAERVRSQQETEHA